MPFKRMLLLIGVVFALTGAGLAGARYVAHERPPYYNCLWLPDGTRVQLNTHLATPLRVLSTSPDGQFRLLTWRYANTPHLVLQNLVSGTQHTIGVQPHIYSVQWILDHDLVMYESYGRVHLLNLHTTQYTPLDTPASVLSLSSTGDFLAEKMSADIPYQYELTRVLSVPTQAYVDLDFLPPEQIYCARDGAWSPSNNQLACYVESRPDRKLIIIDLDKQRYTQAALPLADLYPTEAPLLPWIWEMSLPQIQWSPGGDYLVAAVPAEFIERPNNGNRRLGSNLYFFATTGDTLAQRSQITRNYRQVNYWQSNDLYYGTFANAYEYVYAQAAPAAATATDHLELWRFDFRTGQHERLATAIRELSFEGKKIALLRDTDGRLTLEIRDLDGRHPVQARTFAADSTRECQWGSYRLPQPMLICTLDEDNNYYGPHDIWLFDPQGRRIWPPDATSRTAMHINATYHIWYTENGRFILLPLFDSINQTRRVELVDLHTTQTYILPDTVAYGGLYLQAIENGGRFGMFPWPDNDAQWVVDLPRNMPDYRLDSNTNTWEELLLRPAEVGLWSPDGDRVAVARYDDIPYADTLFVQEADGSREWVLGSFSYGLLYNMQWTQCGDVLAPLRDRLAAEAP